MQLCRDARQRFPSKLSDEALEQAGVPADLIRISVGIEDVDDILFDLDRALERAGGPA